jgi:hypothetical protein
MGFIMYDRLHPSVIYNAPSGLMYDGLHPSLGVLRPFGAYVRWATPIVGLYYAPSGLGISCKL